MNREIPHEEVPDLFKRRNLEKNEVVLEIVKTKAKNRDPDVTPRCVKRRLPPSTKFRFFSKIIFKFFLQSFQKSTIGRMFEVWSGRSRNCFSFSQKNRKWNSSFWRQWECKTGRRCRTNNRTTTNQKDETGRVHDEICVLRRLQHLCGRDYIDAEAGPKLFQAWTSDQNRNVHTLHQVLGEQKSFCCGWPSKIRRQWWTHQCVLQFPDQQGFGNT